MKPLRMNLTIVSPRKVGGANRFRLNGYAESRRIGALQIGDAITKLEGGNPLPPQRPAGDLRFNASHK